MKTRKKIMKSLAAMIFVCFGFVTTIFFGSCASSKFEGTACLAGKVFDQDGKPVNKYEIEADGKKALTDSAGIFYIEDVKSGKISISGSKKGFTSFKEKIQFTDRKDLMCIEVERISSFYKKIENLITGKDYYQAKSLLKKEKKSNGESTIFQFYDTLCDFYITESIEEKQSLQGKLEKLLQKYNNEVKENVK